MKISEFAKVIKKVIREEVRAAIKAELNEALKPKKKEDHEVINHGLDLHEKVEDFDQKNYSKNPLLNSILNETANTPVPTMNGGAYTSNDAVGGIRSKFAEAMNPDKDFGGATSAQEMIRAGGMDKPYCRSGVMNKRGYRHVLFQLLAECGCLPIEDSEELEAERQRGSQGGCCSFIFSFCSLISLCWSHIYHPI